jgi:toxin ParE1/3/4
VTPVLVSRRAEADEIEILEYLASVAGRSVALDYGKRFRALYRLLSEHPDSGAPCPSVGLTVRHSVIFPYIVFYRHVRGAVHILRVVHGRRRITGTMLRPRS